MKGHHIVDKVVKHDDFFNLKFGLKHDFNEPKNGRFPTLKIFARLGNFAGVLNLPDMMK
jgi:hypothetical protein